MVQDLESLCPVWIKVANSVIGIKKWPTITYFNSQDISTYTWADVSEFCLLVAWQWQCSPYLGLCGPPNHLPLWLTALGWDAAFWQSSVLPLREMSINPFPHYSWNQSRNCNCFLPLCLVYTGLSKTSLEFCDHLPGKMEPLHALPSRSDLILHRVLLHWFRVHVHRKKTLINKRPWVIIILQFDWIASFIDCG